MQILKPSNKTLIEAVKILNNGGIVICPTDTVYGFLALSNPPAGGKKAVAKIYKIKKRSRSKPLPVFIFSIKQAKKIAEISKEQEKILKKYWPGKYTFILELKDSSLRGTKVTKQSKIAIRIPNHKFLLSLLKKINKPLAQTSVNISGQPPLTKISEIIAVFGSKPGIDLIFDGGNLKKLKPSQVFDLTQENLTRLR